ncbi:MAG TPA: GNAT family N-acetyltransferase [Jatrophihabitans sp.]|nr:GNAT family N-acetyltransferase [Jatrophihabitans sp.]
MEIVNPVPREDALAWVTAANITLLGDTQAPDFPHRAARWTDDWYPERTWGVRDHGRWVGTLATEPRVLTVPAAGAGTSDVTVDALTGVTVAATHRRRGLLTAMLDASLRAAKERGDALAVLVAAEWPIYGRFGYAPAATYADYSYRPRERGGVAAAAPEGAVRQVEADELFKHADAIFDRARRRRPGQIDRAGGWWARQLNVGFEPVGEQYLWFLHESTDGPDGLLGWRATRRFDIDGTLGALDVTSLVAASDLAERNLWAYLGGIDGVSELTLSNRPVDEPARWLLPNGRALRQTYAGDFLWLALLDVPAALSARGYACEGRLVLEVVDDSRAGYAGGRFRLDASPDGATCAPTTESADLVLPVRALAAAYLGGHRLHGLRLAGGMHEPTPGALGHLDAMLGMPFAPWCQTGF